MTNETLKAAVDTAVADAKNLPQLVSTLQTVDPVLAEQFTGKALLASKSPWGTLLAAVVAYGASRFGLGWDHDTCALVAGAGLLLGAYVMRALTKAPITSVASGAAVPPVSAVLLALSLGACTTAQVASVQATASADLAKAVQFVGVAKGVALVAEMSDPSLKPILDPLMARLDAAVALAQAAQGDATIDAAAITAQAADLTRLAAPVITVVPAK